MLHNERHDERCEAAQAVLAAHERFDELRELHEGAAHYTRRWAEEAAKPVVDWKALERAAERAASHEDSWTAALGSARGAEERLERMLAREWNAS